MNQLKIKYSPSDHENIFQRNYYTCLNTLRAVVPYMQKQKSGKIITVSSVNAAFGVEKKLLIQSLNLLLFNSQDLFQKN